MLFTTRVISTKDWGAIPAGPFEQTVPKYIIHHTDQPNHPNDISQRTLEGAKGQWWRREERHRVTLLDKPLVIFDVSSETQYPSKKGISRMNSAKDLLFTIQEIEAAMGEVTAQIPVTFNCHLYFSGNYIESDRVRIAYKECICSVKLNEPKEKSTIIAQFKAKTDGRFEEKIWRSETDNIIARIAKINRPTA